MPGLWRSRTRASRVCDGTVDLAMRSPGNCDGWCISCRKEARSAPKRRHVRGSVCNSDPTSPTAWFAPGAEATRLISLLSWLRELTCRLVHDESSARAGACGSHFVQSTVICGLVLREISEPNMTTWWLTCRPPTCPHTARSGLLKKEARSHGVRDSTRVMGTLYYEHVGPFCRRYSTPKLCFAKAGASVRRRQISTQIPREDNAIIFIF